MKSYSIVLCSGAEHLKSGLEKIGYEVFISEKNYDGKRFYPNADLYTRINVEKLQNKKVCIIQSGSYSSDLEEEKFTPAERFSEVMEVLYALKYPLKVEREEIDGKMQITKRDFLDKPKEIKLVYTFLPFSKQDNSYETGESNNARMAIEAPLEHGVKQITAIDMHPPEEYGWVRDLLESGKLVKLTIMPEIEKRIQKIEGFENAKIINPPGKSRYKVDMTLDLKKSLRKSSYDPSIEGGENLDVKGQTIIVTDDFTSTGGTLKKMKDELKKAGAKDVCFGVAHISLAMKDGEKKLRELVDYLDRKFAVSNTVNTKTLQGSDMVVDICPLIDRYLSE